MEKDTPIKNTFFTEYLRVNASAHIQNRLFLQLIQHIEIAIWSIMQDMATVFYTSSDGRFI